MAKIDANGMLGTVQSYWNAAYRGLVPGGLNEDSPVADDIGPDPEPFDQALQDESDYVEPDSPVKVAQPIAPVPVVLVDDLSHTVKRVEKYIITNTVNIPIVGSTLLLPRDPYRTQAIINNNSTPGTAVIIGHNDSVGQSGFSLPPLSIVVLGTTRDLWVCQPAGQTTPAIVTISVIQEYDKDTFA